MGQGRATTAFPSRKIKAMEKAYKFRPLLKHTIWGGDRIAKFKRLATPVDGVGESWEISGVEGSETLVFGGPCDGMPLNSLVAELKGSLVGESVYRKHGDTFPLLIKFIDARDDLSIQVHPDDVMARRHGQRQGKTEMWYALDCAPGARLLSGLSRRITAEDYRRLVADGTIAEAVASHAVSEGDCFYIPAGRIHAIGAGCFLVEVQQTSDVTYRIYDYGRTDAAGRPRELHTELAAEAIDYGVLSDYRTHYEPRVDGGSLLVDCPYFTTSVYGVASQAAIDLTPIDSFSVLVGVCGEGVVADADGQVCTLRAGETMLLPASTGRIEVRGRLRFIETHCR